MSNEFEQRAQAVCKGTPFLPAAAKQLLTDMAAALDALIAAQPTQPKE